jgi:hypothetical protein
MFKIASKEVVKDLPKMKDTGKRVCGPCQLGKQTRTANKKTSGILTSSNLELLHMDLMGPTRTSSREVLKQVYFGSLSAIRTTWFPIRMFISQQHPSGRRVIPFGRSSVKA